METDSNPSLKLAIAMALLRSKLLKNPSDPSSSSSSSSESDAQRWKKKAKERKQEILKLKEELKELEDGSQYDSLPQIASCKCYFFDNLGKLSPRLVDLGNDHDNRFNDVLRRRFLRQVRFKERRKKSGESVRRRQVLELNIEDEIEQLSTSVDFLVEQCKTFDPEAKETSFTNWSHQAVDFILASLKNLLAKEKNQEPIEGIVSRLISRLVGTMCVKNDSSSSGNDAEFYVQHLIRQLGSDPFIGQRTMLAVSQRISVLAESLLFMDPFDEAFPNTHSCMFVLIQLIEFMISDYIQTWTSNEGFESILFEEWVRSVLQTRKSLGLLDSRNGLYILYMERVTGELANKISEVSCLPTLSGVILENLFC